MGESRSNYVAIEQSDTVGGGLGGGVGEGVLQNPESSLCTAPETRKPLVSLILIV